MTPTPRITLLAALAMTACATAGGGKSSRFMQADHAPPGLAQFTEEGERAILQEGFSHAERSEQAARAGNTDQSRAEGRAAADIFGRFADKFTSSEWRLVMRAMATDLYLRSQDFDKAGAQAQKLYDDPEANDVSKAIATRNAAGAWQVVAVSEARAGRIDPPRLVPADKRQGQDPKPRVPPDPWKRFIENADRYQALRQADPLAKLPLAEARRRGGVDPAELANIAAQVEFGYDNMEDARRRYEAIMQTWPSRADILESAVPYYLETFLVKKDDAGYDAAVAKTLALLKPEAGKAAEAAKAPGAGEEAKKAAEILARLASDLEKRQQATGFVTAGQLLAAGKNLEAAAAYEKFAAESRDHPDAPNALHNAAVAWERAKEPKKAQAARAALLERYPDSKLVPEEMLAQASALSRQGDHATAQKLYQSYLHKWAQGPRHCLALYNLAVELEATGKKLEAAKHYQAFGRDETCVKEDPNNSVKAVYRGGVIFSEQKKKGDALEMFKIASGIQGVTDTVARSQVEDARERVKKAK
ncbi:MAG TPA: hypothetical protein VFR85_12785 [Anaeromyxobacteraceae bacterium]|nr:hypothetical protein [Anaeromyxobacteraceae bacterium]